MRRYIVFGSNDGGETLSPVGVYEAADHDAAKKAARESGHVAYGTCPEGNWSFGKISVKEIVEVEELELPIPGQMTVTEVIEEIEKDEVVYDADEGFIDPELLKEEKARERSGGTPQVEDDGT